MPQYYFVPRRIREGWPRLRTLVWRVEGGAILAFLWVLRMLPYRLAVGFAGGCFAWLGPHTHRARKVRENLAVAFADREPVAIERLMRDSFRYLGHAMVELSQLPRIWRQRERCVEFVVLPGAIMPGPAQRSVFVTAHVGAWQLAPLIGPHYGFTLPVIHAPEDNPYVDRALTRLRTAFGSPLVSRDGGVRVLMRALDRGQSIGLTLDTRLNSGEPLPFFGELALTNTIPARLALRYGCDLVPVLAERLPGGRFRVSLFPPVRASDPSATAEAQARDLTLQVNRLFEDWIRQRPGQWLCMKRRWPKPVYRRHRERLQARLPGAG
jgi:KDO2-lipid IV(A) lauroyltransferase